MLTVTIDINGRVLRRFEIRNDGTGSDDIGHYNVSEFVFKESYLNLPEYGGIWHHHSHFAIRDFPRKLGAPRLAEWVLTRFHDLYPHET